MGTRKRWFLLLGASLVCLAGARAQEADFIPLFDGKTFSGWEGSRTVFRIEEGALVGGTLAAGIANNEFLCTTQSFDDFELRLQAKIVGPGDNGGIQFRTRRVPDHYEVSGYQADVGSVSAAWFARVVGKGSAGEIAPDAKRSVWGALYDESRRNRYLAWPPREAVDAVLKPKDWNTLTVRAEGPRIQIWLNEVQTVDFTETDHIPGSGAVCLQIHSGAPGEVWHRALSLRAIETDAR